MTKTTTTMTTTTISIYQDDVWVGSGRLIAGTISDCGAMFGAVQDESDNVYELIEEAIEGGDDGIDVDLSDGRTVAITWSIFATIKRDKK